MRTTEAPQAHETEPHCREPAAHAEMAHVADKSLTVSRHDNRPLARIIYIGIPVALALAAPWMLPIEFPAPLGWNILLCAVLQAAQSRHLTRPWPIIFCLLRAALYAGAGFVLVYFRPALLPTLLLLGGVCAIALRTLRKAATVTLLGLGLLMARRTSRRGVERVRSVVLGACRHCWPIRRHLVRNMAAAGVYRPELVDRALQRATDQLSFLMHVVRAGFPDSGVPARFRFDDSLRHLHQAYDGGKGVLVISPHLCCYPIMPRVLDDHVPCSIYLRRSQSPAKHAINMAMGQAGGGHLIHPPANASSVEELMTTLRVLRQGRALFITPDLPRKPDQGVPVTIFGRTVYFPTGVIIMAMRSGAPIVIATWYCRPDGIYHVHLHEPMDFSARGNRQARAAAGMQHFARIMDDFLHEHPEMWWNWLDKRWTRILRRPPR